MNNTVTNMNPHLSRFGLEREPFSNSPDESFFLLDSDRAQRLNMLYHLVQNSEALLLLSGQEGSGKTSLLQKFIAMGNETWRYCLIRANAMMNPEQMLRHIAEGFGLEPDSINFNNALDTLKTRFIELHRSGMTALLLVDDAHELPAASLTVIMKMSELRDEDEGLVRTVLFSEPQIRDMLSSPELADVRHRITHSLEMPELNEQQTADYINYRLSVAGLEGKSPFSRGKMKKIHRLSHGVPALVNEHANAMLHGGDTPSTDKPAAASTSLLVRMKASVAVIGLLAVAGLATYFVMEDALDGFFSSDTDKTVAQLDLPEAKKPVEAKPVVTPVIKPGIKPADEPVVKDSKESKPGTTEPEKPGSKATPINKYAVTNTTDKTTVTKTEKPAAESKPVTQTVKKTTESKTTTTAVTTTARPKVKPVLRTDSNTATKPVEKKPAPLVTTPKPKTVVKDWLATQNNNHFTLQLMGSRNKTSVEGYRRSNKLGKQAAVIKTLHQGGEWYVLVYGSYSSKEKARAAIPTLPSNLRKASPWLRKIGDLKP